ncbi:MAG: inner-rane translocator [Dehalococcoidia bacterium]|nr:inner-rane translocator [Dehalococcoidia bacterium]
MTLDPVLILSQLFNGLSLASIMLLAALGLALSFGLMRVINMAHGELLMVGGYMGYVAYQNAPGPAFLLLALPLGFLCAAMLGGLLEMYVIHRLYGRPLDTLLATWGVGLMLQQTARTMFGATGVSVLPPTWLNGAFLFHGGTLDGLGISYVRLFTIMIALLGLAGMWLLLYKTKAGLYIRAVNQNREMAAALGVNPRQIDFLVFSLGSGLAGLAGATFALIAPVTPTVGQAYIVNAFMVVILGGIGSLVGTSLSAVLVGSISVLAETFFKVSFALVILLVFVVVFLQFKPTGLFSRRSRVLDE